MLMSSDNQVGVMNSSSPNSSSLVLSPFSCQTVGELLRKKIVSWSQETCLPVSVRVLVEDKNFDLHKHPLISKSGYFKRALTDSLECKLPDKFPGGSEVFEMVALFMYGSFLSIDPFNVAALRCASEFLEMTEEYTSGNLRERSDLYLNQIVLQSWDDTLIVLQKCQTLLPWAEELLIVSRCIESLAFMACMEILDPEQRRDQPVITSHALSGRPWSCELVKEIAGQYLWIKDLIALPFGFFERIIGSLRRQGMKEKYVSPMIIFYATKWVLSKKIHQFWESTDDNNEIPDAISKVSEILQGVIRLLPVGEKSSKVIPVGFYFALLSRSLSLGLSDESKMKLQDQVASLLHLACVDDFLLPQSETEPIASSVELATMERIVSVRFSPKSETCRAPSSTNAVVAQLWDVYLSRIAVAPKIGPRKFMDLIEIIPISDRMTHDHLYRALNNFLMKHPQISNEEKTSVCKYLNCQKLSQETCIEAVQNELMPLRLIVQALFVQQLNTHQAFKDCSDSFRYMQSCELSGSLSSSTYKIPKSQPLGESPYIQTDEEEPVRRHLGFLLQKDLTMQRPEFTKEEYESTSFRIQSLEQELMSLKLSLQRQDISKESKQTPTKTHSFRMFNVDGRAVRKKGKSLCQVSSCIGSVNWASQRKYAKRLLNIFRTMTLLGRGKSKRKQVASGFSDGLNP
ncbi:phototropic-responsive NPH3 family protein [Tasmannia lanceolata]|uniref:phototropic-responsive NPH3 family protein n=1 Tax=Tasmannia lanceolata TaxID=3420 RepID=UPI004063E55F